MQQSFETLLQTIHHYKLIPPDSTVLIAVSGGADSLALLHWLATHREQLRIKLHVATLNHNLRPESTNDVLFVQQMASRLSLPCTAGFADVPSLAKENHSGTEAAARKARYDFLAKIAKAIKANYIVTAHHADDQSETILMHLLRGSGTKGLVGMKMTGELPYHNEFTLLRPFLHIRRSEIESYCTKYKLQARIDESNFDTQYRRNEIRHEILPRLRQINPQLDAAFLRLAEISSTEQNFMAQIYQENFKSEASFEERVSLSLTKFMKWHPAMQRRFLLDALAHLQTEASFEHIQQAIIIAMKGQVGAITEFPGDARLRVGYSDLFIEPVSLPLPLGDYLQIDKNYEISVPGRTKIGEQYLITTRRPMFKYDACLHIPEGASVYLRTRQPRDRFKPHGMGGHSRKIKKWFIDNKIPAFVRDNLPLLVIDDKIAAIVLPKQWRIAEEFANNKMSQYNVYFKLSTK